MTIPTNPLVVELQGLRAEASELMMLGFEVQAAIDVVLGKIEPQTPLHGEALHEAVIDYLRVTPNARLRDDLLRARGTRSVAVMRTKLNQTLEERAGFRHPMVGGRATVRNGHGNGAHAAE